MAINNRRANERTPVKLDVVLELPGHDPFAFISKNVSAGGFFLEKTHETGALPLIKVGATGSMVITQQSPNGLEKMTAPIEVVRVAPEGVGVKLLSELVFQSRVA